MIGQERTPIEWRQTVRGPYLRVDALTKPLQFTYRWDEVRRKFSISHKNHLIQMVEGWRWLFIDGRVTMLSGELVRTQGHLEVPKDFLDKVGVFLTPKTISLKFENTADSMPIEGEEFALTPIKSIVVDPGHGGADDPGARGGSLEEKTVTLKIGHNLVSILKSKDPELSVHLTREADMPLTLQERTEFVGKVKADLFVSLHLNSSTITTAKGVETYFLGVEATDDAARKTADLENKSFLGVTQKQADSVKKWLGELKQTEALSESSLLAEMVHESLVKGQHAPNRGVKQAMFYVLMGSQVPAILIEAGFLSNSKELALLQNDAYLVKVSESIAEGILAFTEMRAQRIKKLYGDKKKKERGKK